MKWCQAIASNSLSKAVCYPFNSLDMVLGHGAEEETNSSGGMELGKGSLNGIVLEWATMTTRILASPTLILGLDMLWVPVELLSPPIQLLFT